MLIYLYVHIYICILLFVYIYAFNVYVIWFPVDVGTYSCTYACVYTCLLICLFNGLVLHSTGFETSAPDIAEKTIGSMSLVYGFYWRDGWQFYGLRA